MKKLISLILVSVVLFCAFGCGSSNSENLVPQGKAKGEVPEGTKTNDASSVE